MTPSVTTVVTPAESRDLVTLDDVREQLQIASTNTAQDAWLAKVITRASLSAERYCNRIFVQQVYQETWGALAAEANAPLILAQAPATITSITIDGTAALDASQFIVDEEAGLIYRAGDPNHWEASQSLVVVYEGGFAEIPDDVQRAVIDFCVMEYRGRQRDPMLREEETPNLGRRTFWVGPMPGQLLPGNLGPTLDPHRRGGIG